MKKLRVFEAFAGVGSQRMALRNLGINHEVVGISEIDKYSLKSYEAIHGDCPNFGDISKINPSDLPNMDLFTYSFPCQDLSVSGKQMGLGEGTRSGLLYECEKIIETKKPKYLLLENVKNLVSKKFKEDFDRWLKYLESLGYSNYWEVLNAKDYGIPQNRERVFVISILNNYKCYKFPPKINLSNKLSNILENEVDEKYYINSEKANKLISEFINTGKKTLNINPSGKGMGGVVRNDSVSNTLTCGEGPKIVHPYIVADYRYDEGLRPRKNFISPCLTCKAGSSSLSSNPLLISTDENNI